MIIHLDAVFSSSRNNYSAVSVYFDIRKAFHSVPRHKFLSKVLDFGFDSHFLHLFHSYLTNNFQCVKINRSLSSPQSVTSGLPQGSLLGPLFLQLFNKDFASNAVNSSFHLFADHLKISSLLLIPLCKVILTTRLTAVTLTVSNSTQHNVKFSILEAR